MANLLLLLVIMKQLVHRACGNLHSRGEQKREVDRLLKAQMEVVENKAPFGRPESLLNVRWN